jgi:hypothetical protein
MAAVEITACRLDERRITEGGAVEAPLLRANVGEGVRNVHVAEVRPGLLGHIRTQREHAALGE